MTLRVLIVDDSVTARGALRLALESDGDIAIVGEASGGVSALEAIRRLRPDLVTMDVFLGKENGLELAAQIMRQAPCPILVVTAADPKNPRLAYRTIEVGALDVVSKLPGPRHAEYAPRRRRLLRLVRTLARVPVVGRRREQRAECSPDAPPVAVRPSSGVGLVVIGASTGGPPVVASILRSLQAPFPVPIAVVQHIMHGFAEGHAVWLASTTSHATQLVTRALELRPGVVYLPGDDMHLRLISEGWIGASSAAPREHQRPSVDVLFESVAEHVGSRALGVLLTGMGKDGARGMRALHASGATTLAQEPTTCAVDSMPRSAIELGAVTHVAPPERLATWIREACTDGERTP